jgi:uncharacterized glyoxalase superfamily protein PhnB
MASNFPAPVPEVPVSDLRAALVYYADRLGFDVDWGAHGEGNIAGISRGDCRLFLTDGAFRADRNNAPPIVVWLNLSSKDEVETLFASWNASQVRIVSPPESKSWGLHEFTAADPDGNLFRVFYDFATPEREGRSQ